MTNVYRIKWTDGSESVHEARDLLQMSRVAKLVLKILGGKILGTRSLKSVDKDRKKK